MKPIKVIYSVLLVAGVATLIFFGCKNQNVQPNVTSNATGGKTAGAYDTVKLSCAGGATLSTIALTVTAGPSGAPAGFSIQWMTLAQFQNIGGSWANVDTTAFCKASFSGVPYGSKNTQQTGGNTYNLPANGSVTVYIGDLLNDELNQQLGLSTSCSGGLVCGTQYVFRAFAHGNSTKNRSAYSFGACSTADCNPTCTHHGIGFWKNRPDSVAAVVLADGGTISLGGTAYTADQLVAILNTPPNGNGYIILAHQLIAAKLNGLCANATSTADADLAGVTFSGTTAPVTASAKVSFSNFAGIIGTLHSHNENCLDCPAAPLTNN